MSPPPQSDVIPPEPAGVLRLARLLFQRARKPALTATALLVLGHILDGASLLLLLPLLQLMQGRGEGLALEAPIGDVLGVDLGSVHVSLVGVLAGLCLLVGLQALLTRAKNIALGRLLFTLVNGVRRDLFESVGRARWRFVAGLRGADLNHLLTADIDRLHSAVFSFLLLAQSIVFIVIYTGISYLISPVMTLFAALIGGGVILLLQPIRRRASRYGAEITEQRRAQHRIVSDFVAGVKIAKSFNAEQQYIDDLNAALDRSQREFESFSRVSATGGALMQIANVLALSAFVYAAVAIFALPLARIVVLIVLFTRLSPRFTALQANLQDILVNAPALQAIEDLKRRCDGEREAASAAGESPTLSRELRFSDVSFAYPSRGDAPAISRASFAVPAGVVVALIGPSGAGKSTIADLVLGLLPQQSGVIALDGQALHDGNRRAWRERTAYVPQETFLLHDTIAANLRLGAPRANETALWEALREANADAFVSNLPAGLATIVGDRGAQLSGGERQRIAIARALLRKPQLLVLDEATNALDSENQRAIGRSILALRGAMTILVIAHRPAMVEGADYSIALDAGQVLECGPAASLGADPSSRLSRFLRAEAAS